LPPDQLLDAFLDPRQNWHPGEIGTLTGYDESEYVALKSRAVTEGYMISSEENSMLMQAANTLLGLPTTSHEACEQFCGSDWIASLRRYLAHEPPQK